MIKTLNWLTKRYAASGRPANIISADIFLAIETVSIVACVEPSIELWHIGDASDVSPPTDKETQWYQKYVQVDGGHDAPRLIMSSLLNIRIGSAFEDFS
jgi:hypothetical protein